MIGCCQQMLENDAPVALVNSAHWVAWLLQTLFNFILVQNQQIAFDMAVVSQPWVQGLRYWNARSKFCTGIDPQEPSMIPRQTHHHFPFLRLRQPVENPDHLKGFQHFTAAPAVQFRG